MSNDEYDIIRVEALEAGDVLEDLLIKGQLGFATETPYKMLHKEIGGTTRKYTSDTGDRSQAGKITAVLTTGAQLRAQYNGTYYADFTVDNAGYLKVNASGGRIDLASKVLFSNGAQDYLWTSRGNSLALQGQKINTAVGLELFPYGPTGIADGTDSCAFRIYAKGSPADVANLSSMTFGFASGDAEFQISSATAGAGTSYPINFSTQGNANQFHLAITGDNGMGVAGSAAAKLAIRDVVTQLELEYDATKQTTFTVNSSGQLTITPSGAAVGIGITPSANVPLNLGRVGGAQLQLTDTGGVCLFTVNSDGNLQIDPTGGNVAINADAVGIGVVPETWDSTYTALQIGPDAFIAQEVGSPRALNIGANGYFDDTDNQWERINTNTYPMRLLMDSTDNLLFQGAATGAADSAITWSTAFGIHGNWATGEIKFNESGINYDVKVYDNTPAVYVHGDAALGLLAIGKSPVEAYGILQLGFGDAGTKDLGFVDSAIGTDPSTADGYIEVKVGTATRYIQLYESIA